MSQESNRSRWEWGAVAAMTAVGALLRCKGLGSIGLSHFDEGIYALSGLWIMQRAGIGAIDQTLIPYAPPGLSIVIGLAYSVLGISDLAAVAGPLVFGVASVPLAAWLGRRTFGPGAGAVAAVLAALSGPHVAFSRMAMTDVPFLFGWILAMATGGLFLQRPSFGSALALGVSVGMAQNFKYNGWLAGGIVAAVVALDIASGRMRSVREMARVLGFGVLAGVVACLVYAPWFFFVERHMGYSRLLAHHRSYMGGLATWLPFWRAQLSQRTAMSGGPVWTGVAWGWAWCAGVIASRPGSAREPRSWAGLLLGVILLALVPNLPWWAGLASFPWLIRDPRPAARLVAVWWLVLSILTPFYHPYARLWLPLEAASWVILAGLILDTLEGESLLSLLWSRLRVQVGAAVVVLALAEAWLIPPRAHPLPGLLGPSSGLRTAVGSLSPLARGRVLESARPAVTFYLVTEGSTPFTVVPGWRDLIRPAPEAHWAIVDGALLRQDHNEAEAEARLLERWELVRSIEVPLGLPTLLDVDPGAAVDPSANRSAPLLLLKRR